MKHLFTGLTVLASGFTALAQPDCPQIIQPSFTYTVQGDLVVVTNTSQAQFPELTTYQWSFGDGVLTDGANVTHLYDTPGTYPICLFAQVYDGNVLVCADSVCQSVVVGAGENPCDDLDAEFTFTVDGQQVHFTNAVSSNLYAYQWNFGDGTTGFGPDPSHTYAEPGTYIPCLIMWSWDPFTQDTCWADNCEFVVVQGGDPCDGLNAGFFANSFPFGAQFSNLTSGTGIETTWNWSFGDGTTSNNAQPQHSYQTSGWYLVCLSAISVYEQQGGGMITCVDSTCQEVFIPGNGDSPCDSLSADFDFTVQQSTASFNVIDPTAFGYEWHFGDGTSGDGVSPVHTYAQSGTYQVCLIVWSWDPQAQDTCYADHCEFIIVGGGGDPCDGLNAGFFANAYPLGVQFSNSTTGTGFQTTWNWNFSDGATSNDPQPQHAYQESGWYFVCLTAVSIFEQQGGVITCVDSTCQEVFIPGNGGSPCDSLSADFDFTVQQSTASFNIVDPTAFGYEWHFGDGTSGNGISPVHTYAQSGPYQVCLIVWSWDPQTQDTCYAEHCEQVIIGGSGPCDELQAGFFANVGDTAVWFSNATTGTGFQTTWSWSFGDGSTSNDPQPQHSYQGSGWYLVCLAAISSYEQQGGGVFTCVDSTCQEVFIPEQGSSPCDSLSAEFTFSTAQNTASFNVVDPTASGYEWHFGDGTTGDGISPVHTYAQSGTYQVCLVVWSWDPQTQDSCYADHCEFVIIGGGGDPCDALQAGFQAIIGDATVWFSNSTVGTGFQTTWHWEFGDGTTSEDAQPAHVFPGLGTYEVCLTVTTMFEQQGGGVITCTDTYCAPVSNNGGSPCDSLAAQFVWEPAGPNVFLFQDASTTYGQPVAYWWTFGDGTVADGPNPEHVYQGPGVYQVCLTVTAVNSPDSCTSTICQAITVGGGTSPCDSLWQAQFEYGHEGAVYTFFNTSNTQGDMVSTTWDFGDGTTGDGSQIIHTYPASGSYTICMTISGFVPGTQDTCQLTVCESIDVVLGLDDLTTTSPITAWPQPFDDQLQVAGAGLQGLTRFTLLDMTGRLVSDEWMNVHGRVILHYDKLPTGSYLLRARNDRMDHTVRVIQH